MKKIIISALLAAGLSGSAYAAGSTDLILGFRATGGTGSATNLEVDLGPIASLTPGIVTNLLSTGPDGANGINAIYGAGWASDTSLLWGAIGTQTTGSGTTGFRTIWATTPTDNAHALGVASTTPLTQQSFIGASPSEQAIALLYPDFGTAGPTVGSSYSTTAGPAGSWTGQEGLTPNPFANTFDFAQFENTGDITGAYVSSDIYQLNAKSSGTVGLNGTFFGTLSIFANGNVVFDAIAIPEPSVYAAILGIATLAFVAIRRRNQQVLA